MRPSGLEPPRAIRSQGPQPGTRGVDASRSVQIVQIARNSGPIGRIGRDGRCQSVVTARPPRQRQRTIRFLSIAGCVCPLCRHSLGWWRGLGDLVGADWCAALGWPAAGEDARDTSVRAAPRSVRAILPSRHARVPRRCPGRATTSPVRWRGGGRPTLASCRAPPVAVRASAWSGGRDRLGDLDRIADLLRESCTHN